LIKWPGWRCSAWETGEAASLLDRALVGQPLQGGVQTSQEGPRQARKSGPASPAESHLPYTGVNPSDVVITVRSIQREEVRPQHLYRQRLCAQAHAQEVGTPMICTARLSLGRPCYFVCPRLLASHLQFLRQQKSRGAPTTTPPFISAVQ